MRLADSRAVRNEFFGGNVAVAGLMVGEDIDYVVVREGKNLKGRFLGLVLGATVDVVDAGAIVEAMAPAQQQPYHLCRLRSRR